MYRICDLTLLRKRVCLIIVHAVYMCICQYFSSFSDSIKSENFDSD